MSHTPNELADMFPDHAARIHELKDSDAHFRAMFEEYHALNRQIHRNETDIEPVSDAVLEAEKKQRLALLDSISAILHG